MPVNYFLIEEIIDSNDQYFSILGRVEVDEEEPRLSTHIIIESKKRQELNLEIKFLISNPIGIDDILITGASGMGICLAGRLTRTLAKEAIKCYRASKKSDPNGDLLDHAKVTGQCLSDKGYMVKDTVTDSIIDCIGFSQNISDKEP